jgi:hypothetical protein
MNIGRYISSWQDIGENKEGNIIANVLSPLNYRMPRLGKPAPDMSQLCHGLCTAGDLNEVLQL